jgi:phenylacetate-CoA ligase
MWNFARLLTTAIRQKRMLRKGPDKILALQQRRLRSLVAHAKAASPFYAERFKDVDPNRFDLRELPTLTKVEMMKNFDRFLTNRRLKEADLEAFVSDPERLGEWYLGEYAPTRTSGTQGMKALIVQDRAMLDLLFALQMGRGSVFASRPIDVVDRLLHPARLATVTIGRGFYPTGAALAYAPRAANAFIRRLWLTEIDPLDAVIEQLNHFRPQVLMAYANILEMLAREALRGRLTINQDGCLRQVTNLSEPLSEGARWLIQKAFGVPVSNNYAMGECMALSTGCRLGHGMHLQADWAVLEVVDHDNQPVEPGCAGEKVLMTNLYNTLQPFIRYEVADVVTMSPTPCECGSPLPLILKVEGRTDEVVWIRAGDRYRQVHPYVFVDILDADSAVGWYQIVQEERNRFRLHASAAPGRRITRNELEQLMRQGLESHRLAHLIQMDVEISDSIAPDVESGKLKRISTRVGPPVDLKTSRRSAA